MRDVTYISRKLFLNFGASRALGKIKEAGSSGDSFLYIELHVKFNLRSAVCFLKVFEYHCFMIMHMKIFTFPFE